MLKKHIGHTESISREKVSLFYELKIQFFFVLNVTNTFYLLLFEIFIYQKKKKQFFFQIYLSSRVFFKFFKL